MRAMGKGIVGADSQLLLFLVGACSARETDAARRWALNRAGTHRPELRYVIPAQNADNAPSVEVLNLYAPTHPVEPLF